MTTILQISDTHIAAPGTLVSGRLDTARSLRTLVARVEAIRDQAGPIDAVLISGDLSDDGSPESYLLFQEILAPLDLPLLVIPGNHDAREPLRSVIAAELPPSGRLNWARRVGGTLVIGLDTLVEGQSGGTLDADTLDFLSSALKDASATPVLLALHHPPFVTGIGFMDAIGLQGISGLAKILSAHQGEVRIVCGHIHCMIVATVGGKIAVSAPSPCSSFAYDLRDAAPVGYMDQEDGFLIHTWRGGFQSVRVGLSAGAGPFPF